MPNQDELIAQLLQEGYTDDEIVAALSQVEDEGKTQELETEDATAVQEDGASRLEAGSAESVDEHNAKARAIKNAVFNSYGGAVPGVPGFLQEPLATFLGTVGEIGTGAVKALEQQFYARAQSLKEQGEVDSDLIKTDEELEAMKPEERIEVFKNWSLVGDNMQEAVEPLLEAQEQTKGSSGSISTEFAKGNIGEAARLTANQTAGGLASLVPFVVPGGFVLGPALLGGSVVGSEFEAGLERENVTIDQVRLASYAKGGNEFAWEFVTAGIIGKASKLAGGGASREYVKKFTDQAWKSVLGDSFKEGVSEGLTDSGNRLIDHFVFGDPLDGKAAAVGFLDAAIIGSIVGGKVSTFGQLANPGAGKDIAANALKSQEQKNADKADLDAIHDAELVVKEKEALGTEKSLIDQVVQEESVNKRDEAVKRINERQKKHKATLEDMTAQELREYADNKDKADQLEQEKKKLEKENKEVPQAIEDKINEHRLKQAQQYTVVENWKETTAQVDDAVKQNKNKVKEIEQEEGNIKAEEAAAQQAEKPNPVGTRKRKQRAKKLADQKKEVENNITQLEKIKDEARPTHSEAKTRKRRAKKAPSTLPESATKPIKDAAQRTTANEELSAIVADESIPTVQKERAIKQALKVNAPLIGQIAGNIASKNNLNRKQVEDLIKTEVGRRIHETGKIDKNTWNTAQKAVERLVKQERETVKRSPQRSTELKEELREIDQQVQDGILDPEAAEILKDDIRAEYDAGPTITTGLTIESDGDTIISPEVEKRASKTEEKVDEASLVDKILKGTTVDKFFDNLLDNVDKIYALLPESATNRKAFSGIFADGNPAVEIWDSYFDKSDETGRKRFNRLKKAVKDRVAETEADSEGTTQTDIMEGAFDFLEGKKPTDVKKFLPLLGMLKKAFPGTRVIISKKRMIEDFIEAGIDPGKADTVKGYTDGNIVVLNPDKLDYETPIHEYGHIWAQATRQSRPELYQKGVELMKQTPYWGELVEKSKDKNSVYYGYDQKRLEEEGIATMLGKSGESFFEQQEDISQWNDLARKIWDWIGQKLGINKVEDLTLDQFNKLAVTEIITGEQFIKPEDVAFTENSLIYNYLQVPVGSTRDYTPSTKPVAEVDTHGVFNTKKLKNEALNTINRYWNELSNGGWIGYTTGSYGDAVIGTPKYNKALNDRIESKVKGLRSEFAKEGLDFKIDPKNPGFHIVRKPNFAFLEETPKAKESKTVKKGLIVQANKTIREALQGRDAKSPYKFAHVDAKTEAILRDTKTDLARRGDTLTNSELLNLIDAVNETVGLGREAYKKQEVELDAKKDSTRKEATSMINNSVGENVSELTPDQVKKRNDEKSKWFNKIKGITFNSILSPASNSDFYTLLYDLLPSGAKRLEVQKRIKELLLDPLEKANIDHLGRKTKAENRLEVLNDGVRKAGLNLNKESDFEVDGRKLTNDEVVKLYNFAKDPRTYSQLNTGGYNTEAIVDAINYIHGQPALREYADGLADIYAESLPDLNAKLAEHGRQTIDRARINKQLDADSQAILEAIYGEGKIPTFGVYTPVDAIGQQEAVDQEVEGAEFGAYTVMSGRLKQRTGGGAIQLGKSNTQADLQAYIRGPLRTLSYLDFSRAASNFFGKDQVQAAKAAYGDVWVDSVKDSLKRIITGRNTIVPTTPQGKFLNKLLNYQIGGIMFLNVRSGLLQLLSTFNYLGEDYNAVRLGLADKAATQKARDYIKNSPWYAQRGKGKTDVALDELLSSPNTNLLEAAIEKGYSITKMGDKLATTWHGSHYMAGKYKKYVKDGLSEQEAIEKAYQDFVRVTEETQQSTRPERLGKQQTTGIGKFLLAFANTPQQYNRKIVRALKDIKGLRNVKTPEARKRVKQAAKEIAWYGAIQNAIFGSLQSLSFMAIGLDASDDEEVRTERWVNSFINTILRGAGLYGAAIASLKDVVLAVQRDKPVASAVVGISPAASSLIRNIERASGQKPIYARSEALSDLDADTAKAVYQIASGLSAAGVPADRMLKLTEQIADLAASDLDALQKLLRVSGWERYQIGESAGGALKRNSPFNRCRHGSPLKALQDGEAGQAHSDGTIEVDPNLSPSEKAKTIAHEKKHVADMEAGDLGYDDSSITYMGETYPRKDGKIKYNGKWMEEGDKSFPWEQIAYEAEKGIDTPLKQTDSKVDPALKEHDEAADKSTTEWYNDPETRKRLKAQTGLSDEAIDERIAHATGVETRQALIPYGDAEYHDRGTFLGEVIPEGEEGHFAGRIDIGVDPSEEQHAGILEHEQAHALGFDNQLGYKAQKILGKAKKDEYLNNIGETYGNLQEFRNIVGLKPWERNLTPEQLMEKIQAQGLEGQQDVKQLLENYDIDKLSETLNTIAEADSSEEGRENKLMKFYSQKKDTAVARLKKLYV